MAVYSGKDAYLTGVGNVQSWTATQNVEFSSHTHSGIAGATANPAGNIKWSGTVTGVGTEPAGLFPDGEDMAAQSFIINNTSGSLKNLTGTIIVENLTIDYNKAAAAPVQWTATWRAQGNMTQGASGGLDTVGSAVPENGRDLQVFIGADVTSFDEVTQCLQSAQIVFSRNLTDYTCDGTTYSTPGNLSCTVNFAVLEESMSVATYAANLRRIIQIMAGDGDGWIIDAVRFGTHGPVTYNRDGTPIGYTVNASWDAIGDESTIIGPSEVTYYPPA